MFDWRTFIARMGFISRTSKRGRRSAFLRHLLKAPTRSG